jgi:2-polyprenyl-6-methoxyphenol hydroxylase-like FAD-dependent oxidoreductase
MKIDALIVGAGPTGLTMALELARAGMSVRIIDKATHPAQHSQALVVQARTLEQFQRYGIAEQAIGRGRQLNRAKLWSEGAELVLFTFDNISSRYPYLLFLPQSETESILKSKMESFGVPIERTTELISLEQRSDICSAEVRLADGREETVEARWVIGCDGAHSSVRKAMGISFEGRGVNLSFFLGDLEMDGPDVPGDELSIHFQQGDVVFMGRLSENS